MLIIICILIVFFIFIYLYTRQSEYEHFNRWDPLWEGNTSLDCYKETPRNCMKYSNCGLCYKSGHAQCMPGDDDGPLFDDQCEYWQYTNYYDKHIFNEKITRLTRPWSHVYGDYEAIFPSPIARSTLQSYKEQAEPPKHII